MTGTATHLLFEPFSLPGVTLRNRIAMAPMTRKRSPGGIPTAEVADYYRRRGDGGVGLIFSEGTFIDHPSAHAQQPGSYHNIPHFFGAEALRGWERVRRAVHETGARMMPQLWHVGEVRRLGMAPDPAVPGFGPREVREGSTVAVKAMGPRDIDEVVRSYARCARLVRETGFDGVALHGAHGYLLDQFLWPKCNTRGDEYGGGM